MFALICEQLVTKFENHFIYLNHFEWFAKAENIQLWKEKDKEAQAECCPICQLFFSPFFPFNLIQQRFVATPLEEERVLKVKKNSEKSKQNIKIKVKKTRWKKKEMVKKQGEKKRNGEKKQGKKNLDICTIVSLTDIDYAIS